MSDQPAEPQPVLSVCIVNWNTRADLERCLTSLHQCGCSEPFEIIVVDNASTDGSAELIEQRFPQVRLIPNRENSGFAHANNQAILASYGEFVFLLNPDTVVQPCSLSALVAFLRAHPRAAAVGPKVVNPDGSIQYSARSFPRFRTGLMRLFPRSRAVRQYLLSDWDHNSARQVDWLSGAALCMRRDALAQIGLLDERFYIYCEDVDWCYRAKQEGWEIWFTPEAVITHFRAGSTNQRVAAMVWAFHRSMRQFYWKHYPRGVPWPLRWLPPLGIHLRALSVLAHVGYDALRHLWHRFSRGRAAHG